MSHDRHPTCSVHEVRNHFRKVSRSYKFLHSLTNCLQHTSSVLTAEELVLIAKNLCLSISLPEASALMKFCGEKKIFLDPYHFQELYDPRQKIKVLGYKFPLIFFRLWVMSEHMIGDKSLDFGVEKSVDVMLGKSVDMVMDASVDRVTDPSVDSVQTSRQTAIKWEKVRQSMDLLHFYATKWKRLQIGSLVSVTKPQVVDIMFLRHSQSESNLGWDLWRREPFYFDPALSMKGYLQASGKSMEMKKNSWQPEIVVSSPLRRSLITAEITVQHTRGRCPWIVHPLCREVVSGADDIGTLRTDLEEEFPDWNFDLLPHDFWWYFPKEVSGIKSLDAHRAAFKENPWNEPRGDLVPLIQGMFAWLASLSVKRILVASHGSYIERALNIKPFRNCQTRIVSVDPSRPYIF
eukprot:TRINITY_DN7761_c0_g1_i1.p1 TRINITY_DN7761_c0_g1~~TRINITY_DN7761_c0_g1_i1.p1  ORF type:complete len:416 (-),score=42.76 TRINITY_DN7761_c0_g1_i1:20-1237(-)